MQTDTSFTAKINNVSNSDISFIGVQQSSYISKKTFEYIATEDCEIIYTMWGNANSEIFEFQFWVELGEVTEYEPHKSQTYTIPTQKPFRKIGDYKDTFIKKNGKWYERHYIERRILDGTEEWSYDSSKKIFLYNDTSSPIAKSFMELDVPPPVNSSHYIIASWSSYLNKDNNASVLSYVWTYTAYRIRNDRFTTLEDFKVWLQEQYNVGTPVYFDYILAEPKDIECTVEQTEILDKIENEAKTYKNITHIYSTDEVEPILEGTYNKDIETMINNIATTVAESEE